MSAVHATLMRVYAERESRIPGARLWRTLTPVRGSPGRVLPDGCTDLLWSNEQLMIAGPDTRAFVPVASPGAVHVGIRFASGTGAPILAVRADEIRDRRVPLGDVVSTRTARRLTDRVLAAGPGANAESQVLEAIAREWYEAAPAPDPVLLTVVAYLRRGASVRSAATEVGLGERALHRRSLPAFGYGAKTLARILRMNRALDLARAGRSFAAVAIEAGYADQPHLSREVKALTGEPLGTLIGRSPAGPSLGRRGG
jgi:AraC-like DNA-binding protein